MKGNSGDNVREILYSPGFGAGWTSWEGRREIKSFMLTYQPIIDFIKSGGSFSDEDCEITSYQGEKKELHPILKKFAEECQEKFGEVPYLGGATDLKVVMVVGRVRIDEYDGSESYTDESGYDFEEWL